ncbi:MULTISPECIES: glucosamine-6-phosphate deaminase [unclassified Mycolicibacterium]|uniref:glucosamine-6-phosphate deaminase n=1 Tax=unclassified Mycolicibacterium TaxID=2636767 RepID=UPI0013080D33|nr:MULTISPECIES: glucosamine-6-phosphate deaminase [unclassified Mycolicibacterium]MUL80642.1 glucosamine-6-phosphate deaminase [Mycolicibacterium sp. CBMA 329]MUL86409.1 glucosamine-6-phosphate deaminase [Mycolicibacterium sp. CBMA 331]MUM01271.1 glucosamine-6-phosphate deaminase [Mycolicibacterium sp. CBMA 334]MUM27701.1 glucosamine-6-phosphate deaminase [Mycolicibacterium sp. CBMA 295]MUM36705.1 glucosamine-6-phosphate deaminase [Mycolicibacterium sp. CBMA 247]
MTLSNTVRLVVVDDDDRLGAAAADAVLDRLPTRRPKLGIATGGTPIPLYRELARRARSAEIDLRTAFLIALDEYVGIGADDPRSYAAYVRREVAAPLGIEGRNILVPDGLAADPDAEAAAFEDHIVAVGGVDVQVAGIGSNGHLAFNEPGSELMSTTRAVTLSAQTRNDNARFFGADSEVPRQAITQGLGTIFRARSIVLLANGAAKAAALAAALGGPVCTAVPASVLQRHPAVTVIADRAAASELTTPGAPL